MIRKYEDGKVKFVSKHFYINKDLNADINEPDHKDNVKIVKLLGPTSGYGEDGSGGDGSDGGDGGPSNNNSGIVNPTMRVSTDEKNSLKHTFFSPAIATNGGELTYTWNFDDGTTPSVTKNNMVNHSYEKYGKTYKVELKLDSNKSETPEYAYLDIILEKPLISMNCDTSHTKVFCKPVISEKSINDAVYTWNFYKEDDLLNPIGEPVISTGDSIINFTFPSSGKYVIKLEAVSEKVEGKLESSYNINISDS